MKNTEWLTNYVQVDRYARVRLARLEYAPQSNRPDDCGGLYIAPVTQVRGGEVPAGQLAIFATTNGGPTLLGYITDGNIQFVRATDRESGMDEAMLDVLKRAAWDHPPNSDDSYSYTIEDAVSGSFDDLDFLN